MANKSSKLATFRVDNDLWEQFQDIARDNQTNASALLVRFIKSVVSNGCIDNSPTQSIQQSIDTQSSLSIQDLDKRIDEKLADANTISIQNIDETVKKLIAESLGDGEIKSAINQRYEDSMGQFNQILDDYHQLEAKIAEIKDKLTELEKSKPITSYQSITTNPQPPIINEELPPGEVVEVGDGEGDRLKPGSELLDLKSENPPNPQSSIADPQLVELEGTGQVSTKVSEAVPNDQSLITDNQPLTDKQQKILDILGIDLAIAQRPITPDVIKRLGIGRKIKSNQVKLEAILKSKLDMKSGYVRRVGNILKAAGFDVDGNEKRGYFIKF